MAMTLKRRFIVLGLCGMMLVVFVYLYQFGPPGIKAGDDRVLSETNLFDGSRLFIVAHRTGHSVDAYEVALYRVYPNKDVFVSFLGHQEAFWWGCSMRPGASQDKLEIRAFWAHLAAYSISNGGVTWPDKKKGIYPSYKVDGIKVKWPIPDMVLK